MLLYPAQDCANHCRPIYGTDCKMSNPALTEAWPLFLAKAN
ncbi:MAG: hypothetical protein JWQ85_286 [Mucilaginibacter sp.]|nr:hypothetical protein [Mucilaginibacter sp.]